VKMSLSTGCVVHQIWKTLAGGETCSWFLKDQQTHLSNVVVVVVVIWSRCEVCWKHRADEPRTRHVWLWLH